MRSTASLTTSCQKAARLVRRFTHARTHTHTASRARPGGAPRPREVDPAIVDR